MRLARASFALATLVAAGSCTIESCPEPRYAPRPVDESPPATAAPGDTAGYAGSRRACGSRGLPGCAAGEFCRHPESAGCGEADAPGECLVRPEVCTDKYDPVCGCDGVTYGNECAAYTVGISVRHRGECARGAGAVSGGCERGGCSGELCVAAGQDAVSPCIWRPEMACYDRGVCARRDDGACGWLDTPELRACLASPPSGG